MLLAALLVGLLSWGFEYHAFKKLREEPKNRLQAQVLLQYTKKDEKGERIVLKLRTQEGVQFYTTTKEPLQDLTFRYVSLTILPQKITFLDYLKGFYAPSYWIILRPERDFREPLRAWIEGQHKEALAGSLYRTLFLADPLEKSLREGASRLGISHLLAISGFHLGVLSGVLWGIFWFPYRFLQRRFFPYRNAFYDLGALTLLCMFGYLLLLGGSPSFLRALAMGVWGYFLLHRGVKILSFSSLLAVGIMLVALFPRLLFSVGFFLSMMGVFLIFLHLRHTAHLKGWVNFILLNLCLYFWMLIPVHSIFETFSPYQLFSPLLTMLFTLFYPLALFLHLVGGGGMGDDWVLFGLLGGYESISVRATWPWMAGYGILALLAMRYLWAYVGFGALCMSFFFYAIYLFLG